MPPPECSSIAAFFSFLFPLKDHFCIFKVSVLQLKNEKNFLLDSDDKKTGRCSFLGGAPELQFFFMSEPPFFILMGHSHQKKEIKEKSLSCFFHRKRSSSSFPGKREKFPTYHIRSEENQKKKESGMVRRCSARTFFIPVKWE